MKKSLCDDMAFTIAVSALATWSEERTAGSLQALKMFSPEKADAFSNLVWAAKFEKPAVMRQPQAHA